MPCSNAQASKSKPFGFTRPVGERKRSVSCQRSPGWREGAMWSLSAYQLTLTCPGTRASGVNAFDVELEAHRALVMLRQTRHYTDDRDVPAFPVCAELICES